jgi:IS30 family transposase
MRGRRYTQMTEEQRAEAIRLYTAEKWSMERIAEKFGRTPATIWSMFKRKGVKTRRWRLFHQPGGIKSKTHRRKTITNSETVQRRAATFVQPSLIQLPPHLQAVFEACVAEVRSERGTNV